MVFFVTLVLLDLLPDGFNLPYECTQNKQLPAQQNVKNLFLENLIL